MTKIRISATIDQKTLKILNSLVKDSIFRNKSHVIEKAIEILKKKVENEKNKE